MSLFFNFYNTFSSGYLIPDWSPPYFDNNILYDAAMAKLY